MLLPLNRREGEEMQVSFEACPALADILEILERWRDIEASFGSRVDADVESVCIYGVSALFCFWLGTIGSWDSSSITVTGDQFWVGGFDSFGVFELVFHATLLDFSNLSFV